MNIATRIANQAKKLPNKDAIRFPIKKGNKYDYDSLTFKELDELSNHYCACLEREGIKEGDKVILFVKPSLDFPTLTFSLFKMGAIPILIDPGMGKENLLNAIKQVTPQAIIAEPIVHAIKLFYPSFFKSIKVKISTKAGWLFGVSSIKSFKNQTKLPFSMKEKADEDMAAILFTSGGTGIPKGVVYTHGIFNKQTDTLRELFNLNESQIDLPGFPLFSFFTMAMGMTSCIPDMNPSKPAQCDPEALVKNITDNKATFVAGSPAIWERVANYCIENKLTLPSINYVVMFGAPVSNRIHEMFDQILPNGTTYTPYGATECLPVSNIDGKTILSKTRELSDKGLGTCIGKPSPYLEVKIIHCTDKVIENISDAKQLDTNQIGEIIVKGDVATKEYYDMPQKTLEAKIKDEKGFWHRMGDVGRFDTEGNLWFYGRKTHRFEINGVERYSIPTEAIFNGHPLVNKTAFIKSKNKPSIVIEAHKGISDKQKLIDELKETAKKYDHTSDIEDFYFLDSFPVDVRHNIKIDRLKIAKSFN